MDMSPLAPIALRQLGCFTREQALALGFTSASIRRAVTSGQWIEVMPGVCAAATTPRTPALREWAALLWWGPDAALSEFSAARIHRLGVRESSPGHVWIAVPHVERRRRAAPAGSRVHVHHTRHPENVLLRDGRRVTAAARTLVDLARYLDHQDLAAAYLCAIQRGACQVDAVRARAELVRGRAGSALAVAVAAEFDPAFESILGAEMHLALDGAGISLTRGAVLRLAGGELIKPDGYDEALRLLVEADGWAWHGTADQVAADKARDRRALAAGLVTVRYDTATIRRHPAAMIVDLRAIRRSRAVDLGLSGPRAA